jgi:hypothetical protein
MKIFLITLVFIFVSVVGYSQELGVRFGDVLGNNVALDGLFRVGEFSRIHADLSFGNNGVGVEALWDFLYRPLGGEAVNWYVGVGPSLGFFDTFILGASGEIGLEYKFNGVPISISGDWRPTFILLENTNFWAGGFGFNVRYVFGRK